MGTVKVTNIEPIADNGTVTLGSSGDTIALTSGATTSGFGKVGQVVTSVLNTTVTTTSQTFTDTGLSVSITPSSTSSKVLVLVTLGSLGMSNLTLLLNLVRGSTNIAQPASGTFPASIQHYTVNAATSTSQNLTFLDSPATTSATVYKIQWRKDGSSTGYLNRHVSSANYSAVSTITAMEILG